MRRRRRLLLLVGTGNLELDLGDLRLDPVGVGGKEGADKQRRRDEERRKVSSASFERSSSQSKANGEKKARNSPRARSVFHRPRKNSSRRGGGGGRRGRGEGGRFRRRSASDDQEGGVFRGEVLLEDDGRFVLERTKSDEAAKGRGACGWSRKTRVPFPGRKRKKKGGESQHERACQSFERVGMETHGMLVRSKALTPTWNGTPSRELSIPSSCLPVSRHRTCTEREEWKEEEEEPPSREVERRRGRKERVSKKKKRREGREEERGGLSTPTS